jgi:cytochrome b6-f complex iron-sulfur subunit
MRSLAISTATVVVIGVMIALILFATFFGLSFMRASKAARQSVLPGGGTVKPVPGMSRRDFFRKSLITSSLVFGAEFGAGTIAFLWPNLTGGFGSVVAAGSVADLKADIAANGGFSYVGAARTYIVAWDGRAGDGQADYPTLGVTAEGLMSLYQRCVHLGCRVPFCGSSKWFECPCHGSKYNGAGEYQLGPAPRGMDRFAMEIVDGNVFVDTSEVQLGPPRGTDTINQDPGPYCVATG